jgi:hypothetical protein
VAVSFIGGEKPPTCRKSLTTVVVIGTDCIGICHTAIGNLSDPIGYLLDFTNSYYTALAGNMKSI